MPQAPGDQAVSGNPVAGTGSGDAQSFRLSFAQERIWFLEQLDPGTPVFTVSTALRAVGPLDLVALDRALAALSERHETLRTRFVRGEAGPVQEVLGHATITVEILDRRGEDMTEADLQAVIREGVTVAFDLTVAPLMKVRLVRLGEDDAVLIVCAHHIICDGTSAGILWRDLSELYRAAACGTQPRLAELPVQYADYAEWQRDTIDEQVLTSELDFWRDELRGTTGRCSLPLDHPRPPVQDNRGDMLTHALPARRAAALLEVCRAEHVSPFMLVLAAYELALTRSGGRAGFCVGTPIAGRAQRDVQEVLGCFLNLMPVRSDTPGDPTLKDLLSRVRQRCLRAYAHADLPFERLVEELAVERDLSRAPLFDVLLTVQNDRSTTATVGELRLTPQLITAAVARYDLALDVEVDEGGMTLLLCYATSLFGPRTVRLLLDRIDDALAAFEGDLGRRLSAVPIRARGRNEPPWELGGHAAEATAAYLSAHGTGPGSVVAVTIACAAARLAAVIGTMRNGAAVLLLDPADPDPWRERQRARIGTSAALTDTSYSVQDAVVRWAGPTGDQPAAPAPADTSAPALVCPVPGHGSFDAWVVSAGDLTAIARGLVASCTLGEGDRVLIDEGGGPAFAVVGALAAGLAGAEVVTEEATVVLVPYRGGDGPPAGPAARVYVLHCPPESGLPYAAGRAGSPPSTLPGVVAFVRDDTGALALPGATGELMLSGAVPVLRSGQVGTGLLARAVPGQAPVVSARADGLPLIAGRVVDCSWASDLLAAMPESRDVAVIEGPDGPAAFVTPSDVPAAALGDRLRRALPAHLVPTRIVALPRLPRGRDGSTDTIALAALAARTHPEAVASPPRSQIERALLDCFTQSLDRADLGIYDDFFASGGTSLAAARLTSALSDAVGAPVPLKTLFQNPTVAELAAALDSERVRSGRGAALEDAMADQVLPADIRPTGTPRDPGRVETVFLTGATGFVGSQVLAQLLAAGVPRVCCLVRGEDERACRDRLLATLARYSLNVDAGRIGVLRGDLAEPLMGLGEARFTELADQADVIFHLGAHMNFVRPYSILHGPNVHGTREVVRLACAGRPSELHYVSTMDSQAGDCLPEQPIPVSVGKDDGYVLTKKTAEHLVLQAGERGLPAGIYRPWQITSDSRTGAVNPNDQLALCLTGILLTGIAPSDNPLPLRILPVEMVAKALADMIGRLDPARPIHHFYNTRTTPIEVVSQVVAECGYPVRVMPYRRWRVEIIRRTANRVKGLSTLLVNDVSAVTLPSVVESANLATRLGYTPAWPSDDRHWVRATIEYLVRSGVVGEPAARPPSPAGEVSG
jgi:nonribosomal peptide synthetase DhbF